MWDFKNKIRGTKMTNKQKSIMNKLAINLTILNDKKLNHEIGILLKNIFKNNFEKCSELLFKKDFSKVLLKLKINEN